MSDTIKEYITLSDYEKLLKLFLKTKPSQHLMDKLPLPVVYKVKVNNE